MLPVLLRAAGERVYGDERALFNRSDIDGRHSAIRTAQLPHVEIYRVNFT
jgi:hypothetical protein